MTVVRPTSSPEIALPHEIEGDIVILPREIDASGRGLYDDSVLTLGKALRAEGVDARYQHDQDHRTWIGEKSATALALSVALGIVSNAGWHALVHFFGQKHPDDRVRGRVSRCIQSGDTVTWEWYEFEGRGDEVARALAAINGPPEPPELGP